MAGTEANKLYLFQSTHPQGCDARWPWPRRSRPCFNPRTRKGATGGSGFRHPDDPFQSTHPQGCDRNAPESHAAARRFNPRTRKGATRITPWTGCCMTVSIHAPARVRPWDHDRRPARSSFNPRTRKGATGPPLPGPLLLPVSIHAPARVRPTSSVSSPRRGGFQSTHPQGCDWRSARTSSRRARFNPRTRKGATIAGTRQIKIPAVSIHAPARVRLLRDPYTADPLVFQSTHPQGCDWDT